MRIVLVGSSGHARVALEAARRAGEHEVVGVVDREREPGSEWCGCTVLGRDDALAQVAERHRIEGCFVAIGDNWGRGQVTARIQALCPGLELVALVHPHASIATDAEIGCGAIVMAGAVVGPACALGAHSIVNTGACLDHDSQLADHASLAPGVTTGGNVRIGRYSAIGIGATLVHKVAIGEHSVVGAGSLVLRDVPARVVAWGSPARVVRARAEGEAYL